jgi:hypothetical protein
MKHILNDLSNEVKNNIREQHTGGMTVTTESFSRLLNAKLGDAKPLVSEAMDSSQTKSKIQNELMSAGLDINPTEFLDTEEPECTLPQTGNPEEDTILSKVWNWAQSQDIGTLTQMKTNLINAIKGVKNKTVSEQVTPLIVIGGIGIGASTLVAIGAILLFIIVIAIISKSSGRKSSCQRRRKLVKRFGMDGNFM